MLQKKNILIALLLLSTLGLFSQTTGRRELKDTITDKNIIVPPQIERNFDALFAQWNKNIKTPQYCNNASDQDVYYPDSVYINRLYSFPSRMELSYNPIVRSYIDMYSGRRRSQVAYMLAEGDYYFPVFENALDKHGLPLELKYLPVIESALKPTAVSPMGATGLWQFMLGTGKMYDLEINSLVDERRDPIKATDAAVRYLKDLYQIYGDWNLVIAAYNCGPGNVNKAIRRSNGQRDYWAIYDYLPRETRGYVPAFIAATYIMNYYKEHNICPLQYNYPTSMDTIEINKTIHFQQISDVLNIPMDDIRSYNPQYKNDIIPGDYKQYAITLPSTKIGEFITHEDSILAHKSAELLTHRKTVEVGSGKSGVVSTRRVTHRVKKGETLARVANIYGVTSAQIKKWNKLKSNKLVAGRRLVINQPIYNETPEKQPTQQDVLLAQNKVKEIKEVQGSSENDTINQPSSVIADYLKKQIEETTKKQMAEVNDDENYNVPLTRKNFQEATKTIYHKVRIGETITLIANKYNIERDDLLKWNKLSSNAIRVGQRLIIYVPEKVKTETSSAQAKVVAEQKNQEATKTRVEPTIVEKKKEVNSKTTSTAKTKTETTKPKTNTVAPKKSTPKKVTHIVKKGDNLYSIARKYKGVSSSDILKANKLSNDKLSIGQKLIIPQAK